MTNKRDNAIEPNNDKKIYYYPPPPADAPR